MVKKFIESENRGVYRKHCTTIHLPYADKALIFVIVILLPFPIVTLFTAFANKAESHLSNSEWNRWLHPVLNVYLL